MKVKHLNYFLVLLIQFIIVDSCAFERESTSRARKVAEVADTFNIFFYQDFDDSEIGRYSESEIIAENKAQTYINGAGTHKSDDYNVSIVSVDGDKALEGTQDMGEYGLSGAVSDTDPGGGFRYLTQLEQGHMEMYMSYNIMFRPGMDFVLHGKLPALKGGKWNDYDGTPLTGVSGQIAFVGDRNGDLEGAIYWYSRWATNQESGGNGHWQNPDGTPFQFDVTDSTWYNITIRISLNDLGQANGFMEGYVNGKLASQWLDLELRSVDSYLDLLAAYWFYGGNSPEFATNHDEWILIDDICAFTYADGIDVPRGQTPSTKGRVLDLPFMKAKTSTPDDEEPPVEPPVDKEAPTVPSGLNTLEEAYNSMELRWNASIDNVGVKGYNVYLDDSFLESTPETSYTLSNLSSGTNYTLSVSAFDESLNESARSNELNASTPIEDFAPPSQPSGLRNVSVTKDSIQLAWNGSTDNVGVTGYWIYVNDLKKGPANTAEYTLSELIPGFEYQITVSAFDAKDNESQKSEEIIIFTKNPDASILPTLPEVEIVEMQKTTNPGSTSVLKSLGFAEIEDYGIVYSEDAELKQTGIPIYADQHSTTIWNDNRVKENLQAFYNFSDDSDHIISDASGVEQPVDLYITHPLNTVKLPGQGLKIIDSAVIFSEANEEKLMNSLISAEGITLEAWIKPCERSESAPATILAMSEGGNDLAFSIEHVGNEESFNYTVKMNTSHTEHIEVPEIKTATGYTPELLHHLVYTWNTNGEEVIYINGEVVQTGTRSGELLTSWDGDYKLTLANDAKGSGSWNGTYYLVAIYNKALKGDEVIKNYDAGFGEIVYETDLSFLKTDTQYYIFPFVRTDQGVFFGKQENFMVRNLLDYDDVKIDNMTVIPNPSDGRFILNFEDYSNVESNAVLRIADSSGKVVYTDLFHLGGNLDKFQRTYDLSSKLKSGIYNVMLILGSKAKTERLILY